MSGLRPSHLHSSQPQTTFEPQKTRQEGMPRTWARPLRTSCAVAARWAEARRLPGREHALTNSDARPGMPGSLPGRCEVPVSRESNMRVPQVSERIKEAPAQALRGVFAGIGQLLLITDKLRNKTPAGQQVPQARAPEPSETPASPPVASVPADSPVSAAPPAPAAPAAPAVPVAPTSERVPEARDFDKTGNVRLLPSAEAAADGTAPTAGAAASVAEATAAEATAAEAAPVAEPGAPLPNCDELSIASLRARLRSLGV